MKTLISVFLVILSFNITAQEFAPVGAEWYYGMEHDSWFDNSQSIYFNRIVSEKDTLVNSKNCKKIVKDFSSIHNDRPLIEYIYTSNDTVFFYDENFDKFQILYVFNLSVNDSWQVEILSYDMNIDTITATIDSIYTIQINSNNLQTYNVTYSIESEFNKRSYSSTFIETIGDVNNMFNFEYYDIVCGGSWSTGLRCYEDSVFGYYQRNTSIACDYEYSTVGINELKNNSFTIFPNPTADFVLIETEYDKNLEIEFIDIKSNFLFSQNLKKGKQINVSHLGKGVYFLRLKSNDIYVGIEKLVIR